MMGEEVHHPRFNPNEVIYAQPLAWYPPSEADQYIAMQQMHMAQEMRMAQEMQMAQEVWMAQEMPVAQEPPQKKTYKREDATSLGLPAGWQFEGRPRTSSKYQGMVDQYYFESGTNKMFRSEKAVLRHLGILEDEPSSREKQKDNEQGQEVPADPVNNQRADASLPLNDDGNNKAPMV